MKILSYFGLSVLNKGATNYFTTLFENIIKAQQQDNTGNGFIHTLVDKIVAAEESDSETVTNTDGTKWSKKGKATLRSNLV